MGIFSRFTNLLRMRANTALDKAEDPGEVMDYSYSKQLEQLQQLRRSIADVVTNEKRLEMLESQIRQQSNKLDQQAMQALQANREDLARTALQRKQALATQVNSYDQQLAQLRDQEQRLIGAGSGDTLDRELQQVASQQNVEAQLHAMKQQMQLGGPDASQRQIEGPPSNWLVTLLSFAVNAQDLEHILFGVQVVGIPLDILADD